MYFMNMTKETGLFNFLVDLGHDFHCMDNFVTTALPPKGKGGG